MASKSKRRRRVLGASCILAALIIAGSSFAWFTSKDEVTNRLTASSDYGVSIVESFAPPKNMLPGQTVNKDVYDVNTGTIDAFVKNTVSGVLNYTYESKVAALSDDCIKLNELEVTAIDGVTTNEGGGYLAWTNAAGVDVGAVNSARTENEIADTWHPTVSGTYIFRRGIVAPVAPATEPTFTYAGYYYDADNDDYYKIVIGDDNYRAESEDATTTPNGFVFDLAAPESAISGITVDRETGEFTGTPKISFVKDSAVTNQKVTFTYDANGGAPRLVVEYSATGTPINEGGNTYDASGYAARKEVDYYNKLGESNKATILYEQAKADFDYKTALLNARNTLYDAADTRKTAADGLTTAEGTYNSKWEALKTATTTAIATYTNTVKTPFTDSYAVDKLFTATEIARMKSNDPFALPVAKENIEKMEALQLEITALDTQLWNELKQIVNAADKLTPAQVDVIVANTKGILDQMSAKATEYKNAYSSIHEDADTATALHLTNDNANKNALTALAGTTIPGLKDDIDGAVGDYRTAYNAYQAAVTADANAATVWTNAVKTYNDTVGNATTGARGAYEAVVTKDITGLIQPLTDAAAYTDKGTTIVPDYSANTATGQKNPQIPADAAYIDYAGKDKTNPVAPQTSDYTGLQTAMNNAIAATNTAKGAYDEARDAADASSKITLYVNLDAAYATNWTMDALTDGTQNVDFYLNKVLGAGITSDKLIDSVTLADTVTANDYKNLTFDLSIGLDSAQVTYGEDQKTIKTDAVVAPAFTLKPTVNQTTKAVEWTAS